MKHKAMLAAGILLVQAVASPLALARWGQGAAAGQVTGFVVPNQVGANEPFTFAATNVLEGEVVAVKTVDGEVVQTQKTDRHGRIFLAAGLAAGAYLLSAKDGKSVSKLDVQPPRNLPPSNSLTIPELPGAFSSNEGLTLNGMGMSGNAAEMSVRFGNTEFPVLAGTATEMKTGPLPPEACGAGPIAVTNNKTGETSHMDSVVCYELSAKLGQERIASGQRTSLDFAFKPEGFVANVIARILSGPVSFAGGKKEQTLKIIGGAAKLPLVADPGGQGPFRVAYEVEEILGAGKLDGSTFVPLKPAPMPGEQRPEPQGNEKKKRCPKTKHIRDEANGWDTSEKRVPDPANPGKTKIVYVCSRTVRCSIHKSCAKDEGHGGDCVFTGKSRCKDHDIVETREFDNEQDRKDSMKDTAIPPKLKYPLG
jgi:hypothetical protein